MANQTPTNVDEIDLGQFFQMISKAFNRIFRSFLRFYLYIKKNSILLSVLIIFGVVIGLTMNKVTTNLMKMEVIVRPSLDSRNYLYEVVDEIQANVKAKDIAFFKDLGIDVNNLNGFEITVEPITENDDNPDKVAEYVELLQVYEGLEEGPPEAISDIILSEITNKSTLINHKISFYFKDAKYGQDYSEKLMRYINSNSYYKNLVGVYNKNALMGIEKNTYLITQIDSLILSYTEKLKQNNGVVFDSKISVTSEEKMDFKELLELKKDIIDDIELKKVELNTVTQPINIVNFGKPQEVKKALYGKSIVFIPSLLVGVFFFISFVKYLNRKAIEIKI